jgi:hypothetical protein
MQRAGDDMAVEVLQFLRAGERRRDQRYRSQQVRLSFLGGDYTALNWSRGGFLVIDRIPHLPVGTVVEGLLQVPGSEGRYCFSAELCRREPRTPEIGFRFISPSPALLAALSRTAERA